MTGGGFDIGRHGAIRRWLLLALLAALPAPIPSARAVPPPAPDTAAARPGEPWTALRPAAPSTARPQGPFLRARGDHFEILARGSTRPTFLRGINLGAGAPGHFPGEFAITKADYRRWLRFARKLRANAIRVYALHPPEFYQALREENDAHPGDPIWLFQEVWIELPDDNNFWDKRYTREFEREIRIAVDAVHGNALVAPRPGHASGRYDADVSRYLGGWLLGREWEPYAVRVTQARNPEIRSYRGSYFSVDDGTAMECWLARVCETAASYEGERYGIAHAVSFVNWPTLDPMRHPTEYERGGVQAEHDEDAYEVDPARIRPLRDASPDAGFLGYFANYHVYPYYPDFMNLDPGYSAYRDKHGACNYAGYLTDLKAHTKGLPLLIGEYGVPNSRGVAHIQPQGINHGGASEREQGARDVRLLEDIEATGCAGSLLFALFDEWFKVNWLVQQVEAPRDRDPLWHNLLDAEECYGLIGFDPPPAVRVDGRTGDWAGVAPYAVASTDTRDAGPGAKRSAARARRGGDGALGAPIRALYVTSDQNRLYLRFDLAPGAFSGGPLKALGVALDVLDPERGDSRLPAPLSARWSRGAEYVLVIEPGGDAERRRAGGRASPGRAELFIDRSMNWSAHSRLIRAGRFERSRAPLRPVANEDGLYAPLLVETNRERVSRSGKLYPALHLDAGRLSYGAEPAPAAPWPGADTAVAYDPHAEWAIDSERSAVEVAIPWGLLSVGDPSTRSVLDDRAGTRETECTQTPGIALLAWATSAPGFEADSLGPSRPGTARRARPEEMQLLGPEGTSQHIERQEIMVSSPLTRYHSWKGWEVPITRERVKSSAAAVREAFEGMESREQARQTKREAQSR